MCHNRVQQHPAAASAAIFFVYDNIHDAAENRMVADDARKPICFIGSSIYAPKQYSAGCLQDFAPLSVRSPVASGQRAEQPVVIEQRRISRDDEVFASACNFATISARLAIRNGVGARTRSRHLALRSQDAAGRPPNVVNIPHARHRESTPSIAPSCQSKCWMLSMYGARRSTWARVRKYETPGATWRIMTSFFWVVVHGISGQSTWACVL